MAHPAWLPVTGTVGDSAGPVSDSGTAHQSSSTCLASGPLLADAWMTTRRWVARPSWSRKMRCESARFNFVPCSPCQAVRKPCSLPASSPVTGTAVLLPRTAATATVGTTKVPALPRKLSLHCPRHNGPPRHFEGRFPCPSPGGQGQRRKFKRSGHGARGRFPPLHLPDAGALEASGPEQRRLVNIPLLPHLIPLPSG